MTEKKRQKYIMAARAIHESDDVEIDNDAETSEAEDGTGSWVQAWVWVSAEEAAKR